MIKIGVLGRGERFYVVDTSVDINTRVGDNHFKRYAISELYSSLRDAKEVADWLEERAHGYPTLERYEGGKCWPVPDELAALYNTPRKPPRRATHGTFCFGCGFAHTAAYADCVWNKDP